MATRSLLINMAGYPLTPSAFYPDNGLAQLAACLLDAGHECEIVDASTPELVDRLFPPALAREAKSSIEARLAGGGGEVPGERLRDLEARLQTHQTREYRRLGEEIGRRAVRESCHWIGMKLWNGDGYTGSEQMALGIKSVAPDLPILAGGPQVDFFQEILPPEEGPFDAFSIGEGEPTVLAWARYVEGELSIEDVPNLLVRSGGRVQRTREERVEDLDSLPMPVYDAGVYPTATSRGKLRAGVHEETRGCPFRCGFCNHPLKAGQRMRYRDPDCVARDLSAMARRHGFTAWKLGGSFTPMSYMRKLSRALLDRRAGIEFCGYGRINDARSADFELMYAAGCRALFFGVETGSQLLLDEKIDKRYRAGDCAARLKASKAAGIYTIASLVYPNPGETPESRAATAALMEEARPDGAPVHFPVLLPGSPWWAEPERYGFQLDDPRAAMETMLRYKARLLFPASEWPPLPYKIDGRAFVEFSSATSSLEREVESLGVTTLVSDDAALVARHSGLSVREFRDRFRLAVATGDAAGLQQLIDRTNEGLALIGDQGLPG